MSHNKTKTILVVDDEPDVREYLKTILLDSGFNVLMAEDGVQALKIIKEKKPDLISLDLVMPKKSGNKLIYELKKNKETSKIPILIVTAHAQDELGKKDIKELLENRIISGPGTYLEKPVNSLTYIRSIERALGFNTDLENRERLTLKEDLKKMMETAGTEELKQALKALKDLQNKK